MISLSNSFTDVEMDLEDFDSIFTRFLTWMRLNSIVIGFE